MKKVIRSRQSNAQVLRGTSGLVAWKMKRLVELSDLKSKQRDELRRLMDRAGILYRESSMTSAFLGGDALWVTNGDFPRARDLLRKEAQSFAAKVREAWELEWASEHKSSYAYWLWNRFRRKPITTTFRLLILIAVVGLFLVWPAAYVLRKAI